MFKKFVFIDGHLVITHAKFLADKFAASFWHNQPLPPNLPYLATHRESYIVTILLHVLLRQVYDFLALQINKRTAAPLHLCGLVQSQSDYEQREDEVVSAPHHPPLAAFP